MGLSRLNNGERIASISAILLFVLMFFHWFDVKLSNTSSLLFAIEGIGPGINAWEALDYISIVLVMTVVAVLVVAALHATDAVRRPATGLNAPIAILGLGSALLIVYRIVDPPVFYVEPTITSEGAALFPMFLALFAAVGIAFGACLAMREERITGGDLRTERSRPSTNLPT